LKLLLDEMWSGALAEQLRRRGHDVEAVVERSGMRSASDAELLAIAHSESRVLVTENIEDFRFVADQVGGAHSGLIYTEDKVFPRGHDRTTGRVVRALDHILSLGLELEGLEHWLKPVAD
jgi:predicted nuclease of predicted toxin-antitoxin system